MDGSYPFTKGNQTTFITINLAIFLYSLVVRLYGLVIHISSWNSIKAKQWVSGRKNWLHQLREQLHPFINHKKIWVHCASYGEFEQGRPLFAAIKEQYPHYKIILSFFSPSGYEAFKDWKGVDVVVYLPLDTKQNAKDFIDTIQPNFSIFIKYEFWLHFLNQLKLNNIPVYLVAAVFKPHHPFFKWYGGIFRSSLEVFTKILVQDKPSANLLKQINAKRVSIIGDTRFDRVLEVKSTRFSDEIIQKFKGNNKLIVAGSTWPEDEKVVLKAFSKLKNKTIKLIIVSHEVEPKNIIATLKKVKKSGLTSALYSEGIRNETDVLIINTIGLLSKIYQYADCAYVGGACNRGLHNVLEPTVNGIPVSFYGEIYQKFNEALELMELGVVQKANNFKELKEIFNKQLFDEAYLEKVKLYTGKYFEENGDVTNKVMKAIDFV